MTTPKRQRPYATHRDDRNWYRGVLSALSIIKNSKKKSVRRMHRRIVEEIGRADLIERATIDGTLEWDGLPSKAKAPQHPTETTDG